MEDAFHHLDLDSLKSLHEKESADLNRLLLNGAQWHEVRELKYRVVQLSIALHKRIRNGAGESEASETQP